MRPALTLRRETVAEQTTYVRVALYGLAPLGRRHSVELSLGYTWARFEKVLGGLDVGVGGLGITAAFSLPL